MVDTGRNKTLNEIVQQVLRTHLSDEVVDAMGDSTHRIGEETVSELCGRLAVRDSLRSEMEWSIYAIVYMQAIEYAVRRQFSEDRAAEILTSWETLYPTVSFLEPIDIINLFVDIVPLEGRGFITLHLSKYIFNILESGQPLLATTE